MKLPKKTKFESIIKIQISKFRYFLALQARKINKLRFERTDKIKLPLFFERSEKIHTFFYDLRFKIQESGYKSLNSLPFLLLFLVQLLIFNFSFLISKEAQRGFIRLTKKTLTTYLITFIALSGTGLFYLFNPFSAQKTEAAWFDDAWSYRKVLTIDDAQVSGSSNLTNFPVLVSLSGDSSLSANAQADGDDIVFTSQSGERFDHEIESYSSGTLVAWVRIPSLSPTTDTNIYMYYGNPSVSSQQNATRVWDTNFSMIQHLEESSACSVSFTDSTGQSNTGSCVGSGPAALSSGKVGAARNFDGTAVAGDDAINVGSGSSIDDLNTTAMTIEAWVYPESQGENGNARIFNKRNSGNTTGWQLLLAGTDALQFLADFSGATNLQRDTNSSVLTLNAWNHVAVIWDGSLTAVNADIYVNGTEVGGYLTSQDGAGSYQSDVNDDLYLGNRAAQDRTHDGYIDEVRISNTQRSSDWIQTSYNNQNAPNTFMSTGSEEKGQGPVGYWKFDEAQGLTANDSSSSNFDGTMENMGYKSASAAKINDSGNPGAMSGQGRYVVRTSTGTLYSGQRCKIFKSTDSGANWAQAGTTQSNCSTDNMMSLAIDSSDIIHVVYKWDDSVDRQVQYDRFLTSSDAWDSGINTNLNGKPTATSMDIAVDSSGIPHVVYADNTNVVYLNKVGGSWNAAVSLSDTARNAAITISEDNIPEVVYIDNTNTTVTARLGNANNATSFSSQDLDTTVSTTAGTMGTSIGVDSSGNTWVSFIDSDGSVNLIKHNDADAWTSWQTAVESASTGKEPSLAINGSSYYVFFADSSDDVAYDVYTSSWAGKTVLQTGTYQDVRVKWSYNQNNKGGDQLDYIYSDATDMYYASLALNTTPWRTEDLCISGKCLYFDGSDDYVSVNDDNRLDITSAITVQAWVKVSAFDIAWQPIITKGDSAWRLHRSNSNNTVAFGTTGLSNTDLTSNTSINDGNWHYVAGVYDGSTKYLYIDGRLDASVAATGSISTNSYDVEIGRNAEITSRIWEGFIDEPKVYNYALSAAQIKANYAARGTPGAAGVLGTNTQNQPGALSNGLVGYWKMDESSWTNDCAATSAIDSSGNSKNGKSCPNSTGVSTLSSGLFGNAPDLDGSVQYIDIASPNLPTGDFTYSAWVNLGTATDETIFYASDGSGGNEFQLYVGSAGAMNITVNGSTVFTSASGSATTGSWIHFVVTRQNGTVSFYKNSTLLNTGTESSTLDFSTCQLLLGVDGDSSCAGSLGNYLDGKMDEVRVYNRALSGNEVSQLYNWAPGPIGSWNIDEGSGQTVYDSSGYGNNGTLGDDSTDEADDPAWSYGKYGSGLNFNTDKVAFGTTTTFDATNITVEAWVWPDASGNGQAVTIDDGSDRRWNLGVGTSGNFRFAVFVSTAQHNAESTTNFSVDAWHHLVGTYDGETVRLYVDGMLTAENTTPSGNLDLEPADLVFGMRQSGTTDWDGKVDSVKIYSYPRTSKQIVEDMNAGHPAPGSPVGSPLLFYKFEEGAANRCSGGTNDACNSGSVGSAIDGPFSGNATYTNSGKFGKAMTLDGTDDYIQVADNINLDMGTFDWTVSGWINHASTASTRAIVQKRDDSGVTNPGYQIQLQSGNKLHVYFSDGSTTRITFNSTSDFADGTWHHFAVTFDRDGNATIYRDGKPDGSTSISAQPGDASNARTLRMGVNDTSGSTDADFLGSMDEIKIFNSALTTAQVAMDYNRGSGQVMGTLSSGSSNTDQANAASQEYCIPGGSEASCAAPIGRWDLEEKGQTVYDTSGNGNNGTLGTTTSVEAVDPTWVPGKKGAGLQLGDVADQRVTVGTTATYDVSTITVEAWVLSDDNTANHQAVTMDDGSTDRRWDLGIHTSNTSFRFSVFVGNTQFDTIDPASFSLSTWYHLVGTYDGSNVKLYVNGALVDTEPASGTLDTDAVDLRFGVRESNGNDWDGKIDNVRIYGYARSAAQVAWDYNRGKPFLHFKMDECQGATFNDSSGNGNSGTISIQATGSNTTLGTCTSPTDGTGAWYDGVTGKRNYSLDFDGTDDWASETSLSQTITGSYSISVWFNADSIANGVIWEEEGSVDAPSLRVSSALQNWANNSSANTVNSSDLPTGVWHHAVVTYDGTTQRLYFNGKLWDSQAASADTITGIDIGSRSSSTLPFDGRIDDFKMYNYALTAKQVLDDYNSGTVRYGPSTGAP